KIVMSTTPRDVPYQNSVCCHYFPTVSKQFFFKNEEMMLTEPQNKVVILNWGSLTVWNEFVIAPNSRRAPRGVAFDEFAKNRRTLPLFSHVVPPSRQSGAKKAPENGDNEIPAG